MKTVTNNAFWREILDHLPGIVLVFRIDEEEKAHLIFANNELKDIVGYKPQEFVLASETEGIINQQLDQLINKIAELSHQAGGVDKEICYLRARNDCDLPFYFDFSIFQTKSARTNLIVTTLQPVEDVVAPARIGSVSNGLYSEMDFFVAESSIMQAIMDKIGQIKYEKTNVLIRGEEGTGRHTIAMRLAHELSSEKSSIHKVELNGLSATEQQLLLFGGINESEGGSGQQYTGILDAEQDVILILSELSYLSGECQSLLHDYLQQRQRKGWATRIIAITKYALEEVINTDKFDATLYYELNFYPLLIPALRSRTSDIPLIAKKWIEQAVQILKLDTFNVPDKELEKLTSHDWPGNLPELFQVLKESLLASSNNTFKTKLNSKKSTSEKDISTEADEIIPFDEMNRKYLKQVLEFTEGKIYGDDGAAALLELKPTTLQSKLKKLNLK
jgi:DNA-binding NtrC family response regulator